MLSSMPHASFRLARLALLYALCSMLFFCLARPRAQKNTSNTSLDYKRQRFIMV
jgi:hypothetical protein